MNASDNWIPWFAELSRKVAQIPKGEERSLADFAMKKIPWNKDGKVPANKKKTPLLKYGEGNVDPFSFVSYIAACAGGTKNPGGPTEETRRRVYGAIRREFDLSVEIPFEIEDAWDFPKPNSTPLGSLFHHGGKGNPESLWHLFRAATAVKEIEDLDSFPVKYFEDALDISQVKKAKLTRGLSLANPYVFLPYDDLGERARKWPGKISWVKYRDAIKEVRKEHTGQFQGSIFSIPDVDSSDPDVDRQWIEQKRVFSAGSWRETVSRTLEIESREDKPAKFEKLVYSGLRKVLQTRLVEFQHDENCALKGEGGEHLFRMRPDIVVDGKIIVDAKFKELDPASGELGVESSDIYQMLAYARAYEAERVVLIYPCGKNDGEPGIRKSWEIPGIYSGPSIPLQVATVNMDDLDSIPKTLHDIFNV